MAGIRNVAEEKIDLSLDGVVVIMLPGRAMRGPNPDVEPHQLRSHLPLTRSDLETHAMTSQELLSTYVLGIADWGVLPTVAMQALEEGHDSSHLRMLAGMNALDSPFEIKDSLRRSLSELGWPFPTLLDAGRVLVCYWTRRIVSHSVSPEDGAVRIAWQVYPNLYRFDTTTTGDALSVEDLLAIAYTYDEVEHGFLEYEGRDVTSVEARAILDQAVMHESRQWLDRNCPDGP